MGRVPFCSSFGLGWLLCLISCVAQAAPKTPSVILVSLDGVRWQEFFHGTDPILNNGEPRQEIFTQFWKTLAPKGLSIGDCQAGSFMTVSNPVFKSLPAYHDLMTGLDSGCRNNDCARVTAETLPERLLKELRLKREEVAVFSSWDKIRLSVEKHEGAIQVSAGPDPKNAEQPPWAESRLDKYTIESAMGYLKAHRPRFLYIALVDTDEWGHQGRYDEYVKSMKSYDQWFVDLFRVLDQMGTYGKSTSVLITTDHGRGSGTNWLYGWKRHGPEIPASRFVWLYGSTPALRRRSIKLTASKKILNASQPYSHADIRPTVEVLMGLKPTAGPGRVIRELLLQ